MKKQIWFRPEQAELVVRCLELAKKQMGETPRHNAAHAVACFYTMNRIDEVLALFADAPCAQ